MNASSGMCVLEYANRGSLGSDVSKESKEPGSEGPRTSTSGVSKALDYLPRLPQPVLHRDILLGISEVSVQDRTRKIHLFTINGDFKIVL